MRLIIPLVDQCLESFVSVLISQRVNEFRNWKRPFHRSEFLGIPHLSNNCYPVAHVGPMASFARQTFSHLENVTNLNTLTCSRCYCEGSEVTDDHLCAFQYLNVGLEPVLLRLYCSPSVCDG